MTEVQNEIENENENIDAIKIVIIGESSVGKTSIINQFIEKNFNEETQSTSGGVYNIKTVKCGSKMYKIEIWDTAGQERYRCMTTIFYKEAEIALLVYDITNKQSFEELKNYWVEQVLKNSPKNIMLVIVANKYDLIEKEEVNEENARNYAKDINADFFVICAKKFSAVKDMFMQLIKKYVGGSYASFVEENDEFTDFKKIRKESVKISRKKSIKKKSKCCTSYK